MRLVPELANEPEARSAPDVVAPRNTAELMMALADGKAIRGLGAMTTP